MRIAKAKDTGFEFLFKYLPPDYAVNTCPRAIQTEQTSIWLSYHGFGGLPSSGGIDDQDNRTMQALTVIKNEVARIEKEKMKELSKRA